MAHNQGVIIEKKDIPRVLSGARRRIRFLRYSQSLFQELPMSLTLAGVIFVIIQNAAVVNYAIFWYGAALVFAVLFVPVVRVYFESDEDRTSSIRQLKSSEIDTEFFYVIYHIYNFANKLADDANNALSIVDNNKFLRDMRLRGCKQRSEYRATNQYPAMLVNTFYDRFGFSGPDHFLLYLRFKPDYIRATISAYYNELYEVALASSKRRKHRASDFKLERAKMDVRKLVEDLYEVLCNPYILFDGMRIVTAPGTGGAVEGLASVLCGIDNKRYNEQNSRSVENNIKNLVDKTRGYSLVELADLNINEGDKEDFEGGPVAEIWWDARQKAKDRLSDNFSRFIDERYGDCGKLSILTTSYSTSVVQCLKRIKAKINRVYIIDLGRTFQDDNRLVKQFLEADGINASIISDSLLGEDDFLKCIQLVVTGFEAINIDAKMLHPRCFVRRLMGKINSDTIPVVVGESWKVRSFHVEELDLANTSMTDTKTMGRTRIITDHDVHDHGQKLECCMKYWREQYSVAKK